MDPGSSLIFYIVSVIGFPVVTSSRVFLCSYILWWRLVWMLWDWASSFCKWSTLLVNTVISCIYNTLSFCKYYLLCKLTHRTGWQKCYISPNYKNKGLLCKNVPATKQCYIGNALYSYKDVRVVEGPFPRKIEILGASRLPVCTNLQFRFRSPAIYVVL